MSVSPEQERRRYYRVDDEVALSYRELGGDEVDEALKRFNDGMEDTIALAGTFASTSNDMRRSVEHIKQEFPELSVYLEGLNNKLDILARLIVARDSGLPSSPTHSVNLSASGMSFNVRDPVDPGSLLELTLLVFPSHICVMTIGAVVNCIKPDEAPPGFPYRLGVDFSYIRDSDRELLIRHVVKKQSASLRNHRTEDSGEDPQP